MRCVVGVDLGGTNVRAGAYLEDGSEVGQKFSNPSKAQDGTAAIFDAIALTIQQAVSAASQKPEAVGIAIPGYVDNRAGIVYWTPNFGEEIDGVFHHWKNIPFRAELEKRVGIPVRMANDANAAALGEFRYGSGQNKARCLVMLTVGTGIGGGVVLGPEAVDGTATGPLVLLGGNKGGAELGHTMVQYGGLSCNAGSYGAIEGYCQRDAIITRAQHRLLRGRQSLMNELLEGDLSKLTPRTLFDAAERGDELAIEVWNEVGTYLGAGIGSMINVFAPDVFAVGGQIAKAGEWLLAPARTAARNVAIPMLFSNAQIVVAEQTEDAGMLGAAAYACQ